MTLPTGWAEATLGELGTWQGGGTPSKANAAYWINGTIPWVSPKDMKRSHIDSAEDYITEAAVQGSATNLVPAGALLLVMRSGILRHSLPAAITTGPVAINQDLKALTPAREVEAEFLLRFIDASEQALLHDCTKAGTTVDSVDFERLKAFAVPLPPLAEQRRIVAKLDALTARLARARAELDRVPDLSEKQHLSILRAGMRGGLSADWRESNSVEPVASTLSRVAAPQQGRGGREATDKVIPGVAGLAVNDPGTELPEGWAWVPLLRIAKQETGHTPSRSKPDYWDGGVPWIGIRDAGAHHGRYIDATAQTISEAGLANSSARLLPAGTVCLSRTASVGYVTIMARTMATSQDFATWTCTEALLPEYLMYALMAEGDEIRNFGMGTTHTTIYFPEVRAFHIALPPVEEQKEIVARIKAGLARADRLEAEATRARALLDRLESALLAKAFRGELVPQDPNDEPAQALLDRIRTGRAAAPKAKRGRKAKT